MSATPITDALCTDPAIERRDVPARVWREMATLERAQAAAWNAAIEAAAKACEDLLAFDEDDPGTSAAEAIRALKRGTP